MTQGVEWALHCCLNLIWADRPATATKMASYFKLPAPYLNKQLQALCRVGILSSTSGPRGGFRLARPADEITLLDVVTAIEGSDDAFRCAQILHESPFGDPKADYVQACAISQAMRTADLAWRNALAAKTISDIAATVEKTYPNSAENNRAWFST
jgi:Rrf2 family protein